MASKSMIAHGGIPAKLEYVLCPTSGMWRYSILDEKGWLLVRGERAGDRCELEAELRSICERVAGSEWELELFQFCLRGLEDEVGAA